MGENMDKPFYCPFIGNIPEEERKERIDT